MMGNGGQNDGKVSERNISGNCFLYNALLCNTLLCLKTLKKLNVIWTCEVNKRNLIVLKKDSFNSKATNNIFVCF